MNFLAHAYLSFDRPEILIGNLIADTIKGNQIDSLPSSIQEGVRLHRLIDNYTDTHPITIKAKEVFTEKAGRYNSPFLDVSYDHFLALDKIHEPAQGWANFAQTCYKIVEQYQDVLPSRFCSMYVYMKSENWLYNYRHEWMIQRSFERLQKRAKFLDDNTLIFDAFLEYYKDIEESYELFFPDLINFVKNTYK